VEVRPAHADEAEAMSSLALRSKALWGYSAEFLERCRAELTIRSDEINALRAHVALEGGCFVGFFTLRGEPPQGELDALFVEPAAVGRGIGKALLDAAKAVAHQSGFRELVVHADPHAETFYLRQGAVRIGQVPSGSIPGRLLPLLRLECLAGSRGERSADEPPSSLW
jgi:GNAT superfamily N-acetyltransferase